MSFASPLYSRDRIFIIAETCSNIIPHLSKLSEVVKSVASTGADALKVQLYRAAHFSWNERDAKQRTEFPRDIFPELVRMCHERNVACGASVFDKDAVALVEDSGGDFLKLATREWSNTELIDECLKSSLPTIRSFDATTNRYIDPTGIPDGDILMACIPQYPASNFKFPTSSLYGMGWSSHTVGWRDVLMAVSRGVSVIEKHIAFSNNDYERGWSLSPREFAQMVSDIRWAEGVR